MVKHYFKGKCRIPQHPPYSASPAKGCHRMQCRYNRFTGCEFSFVTSWITDRYPNYLWVSHSLRNIAREMYKELSALPYLQGPSAAYLRRSMTRESPSIFLSEAHSLQFHRNWHELLISHLCFPCPFKSLTSRLSATITSSTYFVVFRVSLLYCQKIGKQCSVGFFCCCCYNWPLESALPQFNTVLVRGDAKHLRLLAFLLPITTETVYVVLTEKTHKTQNQTTEIWSQGEKWCKGSINLSGYCSCNLWVIFLYRRIWSPVGRTSQGTLKEMMNWLYVNILHKHY